MSDFQGQVAVISGGAQGIGGAVADALAARGARIVVWDMDLELAKAKAAAPPMPCAPPVITATWP